MPLAPPSVHKSFIWIDDAASAVLAALQNAPSGLFDVAEDQPFTQVEASDAMAKAVGRKTLIKLPRFLLRFALTPDMRRLLARSQRVTSQRFKDLTGWAPSVPNQEIGWAKIVAASEERIAA